MPEVTVWDPDIEERNHPFGEEGVNSSLDEVAKRISKGALHPKVRLWAIECLDRARKEEGFEVKTEKERAAILLKAVQKKLWVPDPVGSEWMAGAHLMACDGSDGGVCFRGEDCDGLAILLGSAFSSVGLYTMVIGHAYDRQKNIQHVLCGVWVNGRWQHADPSTKLPLGECIQFTRERILSVPNVKVICDEDSCLTNPRDWHPEKHGFVAKGEFVGVDGVGPTFAWIVDSEQQRRPGTLGDPLEAGTEAGAEAAERDIQNSKWPPDGDDVERILTNAAVVGATATCAAYGAGPASVLCGIAARVAVQLAAKIGRKLKKAFTRTSTAERMRKDRLRQIENLNIVSEFTRELGVYVSDGMLEAIEELKSSFIEIWGEPRSDFDNLDWMIQLGLNGAPVRQTSRKATWTDRPNRLSVVPIIDPRGDFQRDWKSSWPQELQQAWMENQARRANSFVEGVNRAALQIVAKWVAKKSSEETALRVLEAQLKKSRLRMKEATPVVTPPRTSKSSSLPLVIGGAAILTAGWFLWPRT